MLKTNTHENSSLEFELPHYSIRIILLSYKFSKEIMNTHYFHLLIFLSPFSVAMWLHLSFYWNLSHYGHQLNPHCQTEWTLFKSSSYKIAVVVLTPLIILSFFRCSSSTSWDLALIFLILLDALHTISCRLHSGLFFLPDHFKYCSHKSSFVLSNALCFHCHPPS